jgi:predicted aldo/keto reductase-like oxidoreductase
MERRSFLTAAGGVLSGASLGLGAAPADPAPADAQPSTALPTRVLGRTGLKISTVGFPGLALVHCDQAQATAGLRAALERGLNYYDVAPAYGNTECEKKMGIGLEGIDRSRYYLACKTKKRDKDGAREELERSLGLLKTKHFDVYQLHHLRYIDEVKQALGPGGAIETLKQAKDEGKVRHLGFSAHTTRAALYAMEHFRFDTVMFPINFVEYFTLGFGKAVIELANEQGAAVLAIKAMSRGGWPQGAERTRKWWYRSVEEPREVDLAMRFALSQKPVVAGFPPSFLDLLDKAIVAACRYQPITADETAELRKLAEECPSVFRKEEEQVARHGPPATPLYPDSPHECGPELYAAAVSALR